jgi:hypothetical protein
MFVVGRCVGYEFVDEKQRSLAAAVVGFAQGTGGGGEELIADVLEGWIVGLPWAEQGL